MFLTLSESASEMTSLILSASYNPCSFKACSSSSLVMYLLDKKKQMCFKVSLVQNSGISAVSF